MTENNLNKPIYWIDILLDVDNEAFEPPPPKRAKRRETKKRKPKEKVKAVKKNVNNFEEIKEEMRRATEDESLDGLSQVISAATLYTD